MKDFMKREINHKKIFSIANKIEINGITNIII